MFRRVKEVLLIISKGSRVGFGDQVRLGISIKKRLSKETKGEVTIIVLLYNHIFLFFFFIRSFRYFTKNKFLFLMDCN